MTGGVPMGGTVYAVALNDARFVAAQAEAFSAPPYKSPPKAPVLFIKPPNTYLADGGTVSVPRRCTAIEASAAAGVVFGRDARNVDAIEADRAIAGYILAIDLSEPHESFFRPPVAEKCRDGFLPVGSRIAARDAVAEPERLAVRLEIDGVVAAEIDAPSLVRPISALIQEISAFMTFRAGDVLLAMLTPPGVRAPVGSRIAAVSAALGRLEATTRFEAEAAT